MPKVTGFRTVDVRFPTSRGLDGSDAMNKEPDYSAALLILETDDPTLEGHGFVFTCGRGNDLQCDMIEQLAPYAVGRDVADLATSMGEFARSLVRDSQIRWLGPEKGVTQMAAGAVVNAAWDLVTKHAKKPLWKFLSDLTPEQIVRQSHSALPMKQSFALKDCLHIQLLQAGLDIPMRRWSVLLRKQLQRDTHSLS